MNEKVLTPPAPVLLVDDEPPWLRSLSVTLRRSGGINHILQCSDSREVMGMLARQKVSLVILDLTMPHVSGEELLAGISRDFPGIPVIILSGLNQVDTAVRCIKSGAFDYFVKTTEQERLVAGVQRALAFRQIDLERRNLKDRFFGDRLEHPAAFADLVGNSPRLHAICQYIEAIAASSEPVLITGESGVGKELIARAIQKVSRPEKPFVAVNVAGLDDNMFADTLFGHLKGAFTDAAMARAGMIERAKGGVLFLDEIGDLGQASQVKLLRLIQEGEYYPLGSDTPCKLNARLVFSTNHDLKAREADGEFRRDLFYRINAHHINVPPLRERSEDIAPLLEHFLAEAARELKKTVPTIPRELVTLLGTHPFPGNARELRGMVFNALSLHRSGVLSMNAFRKALGQQPPAPAADPPLTVDPESNRDLFQRAGRLPTLTEAGDLLVEEAMRRSRNNQSIAAGLLGISRQALSKRLKKKSSSPP